MAGAAVPVKVYQPDDHRCADDAGHQLQLVLFNITEQRLHGPPKVVTGKHDTDCPDAGANQIEQGKLQVGYVAHADGEGCYRAQAIQKPEAQEEQDLVPLQYVKHALCAWLP